MPLRPLSSRAVDSPTDRRTFLKACGAAAGSVVLAPLSGCQQAPPPPEPTSRPSHLVQFGHTDLWVSRHCQGTAFRRHLSREGGDVEAHKLIRHCIDIGINFFDSAEGYGMGGSETALGHGVAGRRNEVVIATKGSPHPAGEKPLVFTKEILTRKCEASLKRLNTDYIDIYLLHAPDAITPSSQRPEPPAGTATLEHMEMIADTMDSLVQSGKIRYWGVSSHLAKQVDELIEIGMRPDRSGKSRLAGLQDYYNIVSGARRDFMSEELFPLIRKGNLGLMAFSPLGEGRLVPGREPEEGSPLTGVIQELDRVAEELGVSRPQVCVAWVLSHPEVTSALSGGEKPEHVEDNFKGTQLTLPDEALTRLKAASDTYNELMAKAEG
ncbi:MAG: aldo/keto reductase [Acidobacteriota bacterium]|nr:aldo/keto reductase [Acidobacteriota bacterium]